MTKEDYEFMKEKIRKVYSIELEKEYVSKGLSHARLRWYCMWEAMAFPYNDRYNDTNIDTALKRILVELREDETRNTRSTEQ
jgi:hypothetical protein